MPTRRLGRFNKAPGRAGCVLSGKSCGLGNSPASGILRCIRGRRSAPRLAGQLSVLYYIELIARESWLVLGQMSPYLLLGFLVAGVLSVLVSPEFVERHLGKGRSGGVLKAVVFGVPLPLCSCGVIPLAASARRHGASRGATVAFLLSTPQTGVDSIAATYAMLGGVFAVFRPVAALVTGLFGGLLVQAADNSGEENTAAVASAGTAGSKSTACTAECCDANPARPALIRMLRYGLVTLPRDIAWPLLLGVVVAGTIAAIIPPGAMQPYVGGGVLSMLMMIAVGMPVYICATASVPVAAGLIHLGASPGAALAFLIAGPATNAATVMTVWRVLGRRTLVLYILTIVASAVLFGLTLDAIYNAASLPAAVSTLECHQHIAVKDHLWAVALLLVLGGSIVLGGRRAASLAAARSPKRADDRRTSRVGQPDTSVPSPGRQVVLEIQGMTCNHCAAAVKRALESVSGVIEASVGLKPPRAVVTCRQPASTEQLAAAVEALGYRVSSSAEMPR